MGTIMDYLDWRGDITLKQSPFNEVDNLILAQMSYVELEGIVPEMGSTSYITVREAARRYFQHHAREEMEESKSFVRYAPLILEKMGKSVRFGNARLCNYVNRIDLKEQKQFAAIHVVLSDKTTYIAFRGTDDTLIGWQEDFNMSYRTVPAQDDAVKYVNSTAKGLFTKFRLGGHSKGGNLAVYAGVHCHNSIRKKIIDIYNNDGPGFITEVLQNPNYEKTLEKVHTYIPETSVIGMLLEHAGQHTVVGSTEKGLMQHDPMSWEVLGTHFIYKESISNESVIIDEIITGWLGTLDDEAKEEFVVSMFGMLEATGARNLSDIIEGGIKSLIAMLKTSKNLTDNTRTAINKLIKLAANKVMFGDKESRIEEKSSDQK